MNLSKVSVYLKTVGNPTVAGYFTVDSASNATFAAANFSSIQQSGNPSVFTIQVEDAHSSGVMECLDYDSENFNILNYPIKFSAAGKYYVYMRVLSKNNTNLNINIYINGVAQIDESFSVNLDEFTWLKTSVVIPDNRKHDLGIQIATTQTYFDEICITQEQNLPANRQAVNNFCTLHAKLYNIDAQKNILSSVNFYDYKTTITDVVKDSWYNFVLKPLFGTNNLNIQDAFGFGLFIVGTTSSNYVIWDYASDANEFNSQNITTYFLDYDTTSGNYSLIGDKKYAINFYEYADSLDLVNNKIVVQPASIAQQQIENFAIESIKPAFYQTKISNLSAETNKVQLNLSDRIITIVMDQSGSMTWNDSEGLRHTMARRIVDRVEATYPGELQYNLLSFGGTPIKVDLFAVLEETNLDTNNFSDVSRTFFADQESGYAGIRIIRRTDAFPSSPLDGDIVSEGFISVALDTDLVQGQEYFYGIYTYNSDGVFSEGKFLRAKAQPRILPSGVGNYQYRVVAGTGIRRDANTLGLYHLNEEIGSTLYDFSNTNLNLYANDDEYIWLSYLEVPNGLSGLRLNGTTHFAGLDNEAKMVAENYTIMAWIQPFGFQQNRVIFSRTNEQDAKCTYKFGIDTNGNLFFTLDDETFAISDVVLRNNRWQHVAVVVNTVDLFATFYIDGEQVGGGGISKGVQYSEEAANVYIGSNNSSFLGKITEVSIHNTIRSDSYINAAAFYPTRNEEYVFDNGDRLVIISFNISENSDYLGNKVKIIRKAELGAGNFEIDTTQTASVGVEAEFQVINPILKFTHFGEKIENSYQGEVIYEDDVTLGETVLTLPYDYIHGVVYNFRAYTYNTLGNFCADSDAVNLEVTIPYFRKPEEKVAIIQTPVLPSLTNVQSQTGNRKCYFTWDAVNNEAVSHVRVYWSDIWYPAFDSRSQNQSSALLVFIGDKESTEYVDRFLENDKVYYYAFVTADIYGNLSAPVYLRVVPSARYDDSNFPLLEVKNFTHEIINEKTILLKLNQPVKFKTLVDAYFDERVVLFAQVTDVYGRAIENISLLDFAVTARIDTNNIPPNYFDGETQKAVIEPADAYVLNSAIVNKNTIKGIFRMTNNPTILAGINELIASVKLTFSITNPNIPTQKLITINSETVAIKMRNPLEMQLLNIGTSDGYFGDPNKTQGNSRVTLRRASAGSASANGNNTGTDDASDNSSNVDSQNINNNSYNKVVNSDIIRHYCKELIDIDTIDCAYKKGCASQTFQDFNGCYIRRNRPYQARCVASYKGGPLPEGVFLQVAVLRASEPGCRYASPSGGGICSGTDISIGGSARVVDFIPSFTAERSRDVRPPATSIEFTRGLQTLEDGGSKVVSYVDIPLLAPNRPLSVGLYCSMNFAGVERRVGPDYIVFENILRINLSVRAPEANCIDTAEQFATIYMVDPDSTNPINPTSVAIDEQIPVRWEARRGFTSKNRPFFSTDTVPLGPEIYSYAINGIAKKVFFGPVCDVRWYIQKCRLGPILLPELHVISASVTYDGLTAFDEKVLSFEPPAVEREEFNYRFLMTLPSYLNQIYADGYQYVKGTIWHDANNAIGSSANCFLTCSLGNNEPIYVLNAGQLVQIETGDEYEVIYGDDVVLRYDANIQETLIDGGRRSIGFAEIPLSSTRNYTEFYLRINKFVGEEIDNRPPSDAPEVQTACPCIDINPATAQVQANFIRARTTYLADNGYLQLTAGGGWSDGAPPTAVKILEPLYIRYKGIRRGGIFVDQFACDGVSQHEIVFSVTFRGQTVPVGTALFVTLGGRDVEKITVFESIVYTDNVEDDNGFIESIAVVRILPILANSDFSAQLQVECRYDKRGDIVRNFTRCIEISYRDRQVEAVPETVRVRKVISAIYDARMSVYDTVDDKWLYKRSMPSKRGGLTLSWTFDEYSEYLFAVGGLDGNSVLGLTQKYDVMEDKWYDVASMDTPRCNHVAAVDGNYIYVFGGLAVNADKKLQITNTVERYNIYTDEWEYSTPMPSIDDYSYAVAFGKGVTIGSKLHIVCGITSISEFGAIQYLNDRVLTFDFDTLTWELSEKFTGIEASVYGRIAPFVFLNSDGEKVKILGGASYRKNILTDKQELFFPTDTFAINLADFTIDTDEFKYQQIPTPRYKGEAVSVVDQHYFIGGTSEANAVNTIFERLEENGESYTYARLADFKYGASNFAAVSDNWRYIYACGGINSGRSEGFLQVAVNVNPSIIKLDGKQSCTIKIELTDDLGRKPTKDVRVLVQGVLVFPNAAGNESGADQEGSRNSILRESLVYPVVFSANDFIIKNGVGSTILLPRSEDILTKTSEIRQKLGLPSVSGEGDLLDGEIILNTNEIKYPYSIQIKVTVLDSFYYGQTVQNLKDNTTNIADTDTVSTPPNVVQTTQPNNPPANIEPESEVPEDVRPVIFERCIPIFANELAAVVVNPPTRQPNVGRPKLNSSTITQTIKDAASATFSLNPAPVSQLDSPTVTFYNDELWLPNVVLHGANLSYQEVLTELSILKSNIPYGGSPLFDALSKSAALLLGEDLDGYAKSIYVNTDNEINLSSITIDQSIADIQAIDGFYKTPVILNNYSVVFPLTLSAMVARTDTGNLEKIAKETNGQSQSVIDADGLDIVLNNSIGRLQGSIGYGTYSCEVELAQLSVIDSIKLDFELFENTEGSWSVQFSEDGYNYTSSSFTYNADETLESKNVFAKFIKFEVGLLSGLSASIEEEYELIATAGVPALTKINIFYNKPTIKYLFLDADASISSAQQVVVSVSANMSQFSSILVGAVSELSHSWKDYDKISKPAVNQYGKIFIPIRYKTDSQPDLNETLERIDGFVYKTKYGSWENNSTVIIYSTDMKIINNSEYVTYPQDGIVVFNSKKYENFYISIENSQIMRLGLQITNFDSKNVLTIDGLGYMYNTNSFLPPPLAQKEPELRALRISPDIVTVYDKISISYQYIDYNGDQEVFDKAQIKWYKNGTEIEYLRNLREWNDIENENDPIYQYAFSFTKSSVPQELTISQFARSKGESILKTDDVIFFTMQVFDGNFYSKIVRSFAKTVQSEPPEIGSVVIKAIGRDGRETDIFTTGNNLKAVFTYFSDERVTQQRQTQVVWYVNGFEFKRGTIDGSLRGIANDQILVGEVVNNVIALSYGNIIQAKIIPISGDLIGAEIASEEITVGNEPPVARNVTLSPSPRASRRSALQLFYNYFDPESFSVAGTQNDQSLITWFVSFNNEPFTRITDLQNLRTAPPSVLLPGQIWYVEVTPFDGITFGDKKVSNRVTIF